MRDKRYRMKRNFSSLFVADDAPTVDDRTGARATTSDSRYTPVTQLTPDDVLLDGGPMPPHDSRENPTRRQVEQEVIKVNPSIESMDGRG